MARSVTADGYQVATTHGVFANDYPVHAQRHLPGYAFVVGPGPDAKPVGYYFLPAGCEAREGLAERALAFLHAVRPDLLQGAEPLVRLGPAAPYSYQRHLVREAVLGYEHAYSHCDSNVPRRDGADADAWLAVRSDLLLARSMGFNCSPVLRQRFGVDLPDDEVMPRHSPEPLLQPEDEMVMG